MQYPGAPFGLLTRLAPEKRIGGTRGSPPMNDFALPETRYALSGDVNIAYQVMGDGPIDIVMVPGFISHVEFTHELAGLYGIPAPSFDICPRRLF